jgi:HAD superfamily hydrolase (TIGR01509 family)
MMRFHGAIFDVDGVLVDSPHEAAWRESLQLLMDGPWLDILPLTTYAPDRFTTEVYQEHLAGKPRKAGAKAALDYFGVPDPDGQRLQEYMDTKQTYLIALIDQGRFFAFDDALRLLLGLKGAGVKIGAASSSKNADLFLRRISINAFLERGGAVKHVGDDAAQLSAYIARLSIAEETTLLDMFDANVCGRDFARGKPDPEIFLTAVAELGLAPAECVVIEDATSGVQAAKAGGMACIGVARLGDEHLLQEAQADWVVTSLDELPIDAIR